MTVAAGTPVDQTALNGSVSVTIPANCRAAVLSWAATGGRVLTATTLAGAAETDGADDVTGNESQISVACWVASAGNTLPSGSQTLAWTNTAGDGDGPQLIFIPITADNDLELISIGANTTNPTASITIASNTGDYAVAVGSGLDAMPTLGGTGASALHAGFDNSAMFARAFTVTAGASNSTATSGSPGAEPGVVMVVLREAEGGGGGGEEPVAVDHSSVLSFPVLCRRPSNGKWTPPGRRSVAGSVQFTRSKSGIYLPRRLAA